MQRKAANVPPPFQTGFVVDDLDAALRYWTEVIGAGPFFVFNSSEWEELYYNGAPTQVETRMALGQWGGTQIEFIQQTNDAPSPYRTFKNAGHRGLHHFCSMVDDLDAAVAKLELAGKQRSYWGVAKGGVRFAYLVEDEHPGSMIELIEHSPAIDGLMRLVADAAVNWDGSEPVRHIG